jgi:hypothetical protein
MLAGTWQDNSCNASACLAAGHIIRTSSFALTAEYLPILESIGKHLEESGL